MLALAIFLYVCLLFVVVGCVYLDAIIGGQRGRIAARRRQRRSPDPVHLLRRSPDPVHRLRR
jgi:hypothetical protein